MTGNTMHLSILTLNVNSLNAPIKRHRIASWIKNNTQLYVAEKSLISLKKINTGLGSKGGKIFSKKMDPIGRQE
jgi:hypothetical protein